MIRSVFAWGCAAVAALLLIFLLAVVLGLMRLPLMNINREVTQHSQQYVETKRSLLLSLIQDYEQVEGQDGRQIAIANRICEESTLIPHDELPASVASFVSRHC